MINTLTLKYNVIPYIAELCWVEANGKDGQADKDFDEHAKVKKDRIN